MSDTIKPIVVICLVLSAILAIAISSIQPVLKDKMSVAVSTTIGSSDSNIEVNESILDRNGNRGIVYGILGFILALIVISIFLFIRHCKIQNKLDLALEDNLLGSFKKYEEPETVTRTGILRVSGKKDHSNDSRN